jgi:chemotaxis protein CheD
VNEIHVRIADYAVGKAGASMVTVGLGSCIAIILHDGRAGVGALAHCLLPDVSNARDSTNPARFPASIVPVMVAELKSLGSNGKLVAKLVGGASMFRSLMISPAMNVGERNIVAAREVLRRAGIPVAAEDVGGESGRSIRFSVRDGSVVVRTVRGGERVI